MIQILHLMLSIYAKTNRAKDGNHHHRADVTKKCLLQRQILATRALAVKFSENILKRTA